MLETSAAALPCSMATVVVQDEKGRSDLEALYRAMADEPYRLVQKAEALRRARKQAAKRAEMDGLVPMNKHTARAAARASIGDLLVAARAGGKRPRPLEEAGAAKVALFVTPQD